MRGALIVNPWKVEEVSEASLQQREREGERERGCVFHAGLASVAGTSYDDYLKN